MPRHSDRARGTTARRSVAQRDLRFNNVSTYAPAFLASFVFPFLPSTFLPPLLLPRVSHHLFPPSVSFRYALSLLALTSPRDPSRGYRRDTASRRRRRKKSACLRRGGAVKLLCIYYRTITNDVPPELCHSAARAYREISRVSLRGRERETRQGSWRLLVSPSDLRAPRVLIYLPRTLAIFKKNQIPRQSRPLARRRSADAARRPVPYISLSIAKLFR